MFGVFTAAHGRQLSPGLLADLDRDSGELARLSASAPELYRAELGRLVRRHADGEAGKARDSAAEAAETLDWLGKHEAASRPGPDAGEALGAGESRPQLAARVGVFLRQEAR